MCFLAGIIVGFVWCAAVYVATQRPESVDE